MTPSPNASGFRPDIAVTTLSEDVDALVDNLRRAIELSDRGQPCVCSSSSPCYMHAEIQRGLSSLHKLAFLARKYEEATTTDLPSGACPPDATVSTERRLGRPEGGHLLETRTLARSARWWDWRVWFGLHKRPWMGVRREN